MLIFLIAMQWDHKSQLKVFPSHYNEFVLRQFRKQSCFGSLEIIIWSVMIILAFCNVIKIEVTSGR